MKYLLLLIAICINFPSISQETNIVILNKNEEDNFIKTIRKVPAADEMYDSVYSEAMSSLYYKPRPNELLNSPLVRNTN